MWPVRAAGTKGKRAIMRCCGKTAGSVCCRVRDNLQPGAVVVSNGHVYVAGQYELLEAGVWKDGKAIRLPAWEGYSSAVYGIFVK